MTDACGEAPASGAFSAVGDRWQFEGTLTFDDATAVLERAAALPLPASGVVDMAGLLHAGSAAPPARLGLKKAPAPPGRRWSFAAFPPTADWLAPASTTAELFPPR